jgi:hypothetical protein
MDDIPRPVERLIETFTTGDSAGEIVCQKLLDIFDNLSVSP